MPSRLISGRYDLEARHPAFGGQEKQLGIMLECAGDLDLQELDRAVGVEFLQSLIERHGSGGKAGVALGDELPPSRRGAQAARRRGPRAAPRPGALQ